ncbi:radical SAM protein [Rubrimonas cliftonensis]|uniref:Radical SAM superfamily enzyme, MoaA/NifB/PqqE/SkfB family n=1 Tax=Rubrimonas cliftonensis TaxID=89524 RepID=A0A1H3VTV7_9RHOB|nr:radical SAM protein [Rubrimonas cliftonensis]SDZ77528.1 Radical SAM superfamily enzyme, MoaA/NifB/PqqE/SkfB family [Rubrimonas cliftonensis]
MADRPATRTLQIHVTRRCNLTCRHCYSSSGPDVREALEARALTAALDDAAALGFTFATLSGGEPFLYPAAPEIVAHAKGLGMRTAIVTNGMYLDPRRLAPLQGALDLLAVSLDGAPARHDWMRANPRAFETMAAKLPALRDSGVPFGFLFTLSRDNVGEIAWAAEFAVEQGAALLQIHPLDTTGRAEGDAEMAAAKPDDDAALRAAEAATAAQARWEGRLKVVLDYQLSMPGSPEIAPEIARGRCGREAGFADVTSPLVIESDGAILPMGHGFARRFAVGRLGQGRLAQMAADWMRDGRAEAFRDLVARTRVETRAETEAAATPRLRNLAHAYRRASLAAPDASAA